MFKDRTMLSSSDGVLVVSSAFDQRLRVFRF